MNDTTWSDKLRLRSHFGFTLMPFAKNMKAAQMFDSSSQRELLRGLQLWTDVRGLCLVSGPPGVGKSITLRRFVYGLDQALWRVIDFSYLPSTPTCARRRCRQGIGVEVDALLTHGRTHEDLGQERCVEPGEDPLADGGLHVARDQSHEVLIPEEGGSGPGASCHDHTPHLRTFRAAPALDLVFRAGRACDCGFGALERKLLTSPSVRAVVR